MPLIAVLDDDEPTRKFLSDEITSAGCEFVGFERKDIFLQQLPMISPDLIITDIHSPGMNGIDFLLQLKRQPRYRNIPVIIVSGNIDVGLAARALELGVRDILGKPFEIGDLHAAIREGLKSSQRNPT